MTEQSLQAQLAAKNNAPKETIIHINCKLRKGSRIDIRVCQKCIQKCDKYFNLEVAHERNNP